MALIKCLECGHEVSNKASTCPNCGCPIEKRLVCNECGAELSPIDKVCPNCGNPIQTVKKKYGATNIKAVFFVLLAIFVPIAFMGGVTGRIYQQFAISISFAVLFSGVNALTLSPALSATLLKPLKPKTSGFLFKFEQFINASKNRYVRFVAWVGRKFFIILMVLFALIGLNMYAGNKIQSSFLPDEDQGAILANIQLPEGSSGKRTQEVIDKTREIFKTEDKIKSVMNLRGFSILAGQGENVGFNVIVLKPWDERKDIIDYSTNIKNRLNMAVQGITDASIMLFEFPAIPASILRKISFIAFLS